MKKFISFIFIGLMGLGANAEPKKFGASFDSAKAPVSLSTVFKTPAAYKGKKLVLKGAVEKVCKQSGCWLTLKEGDKAIMTRFKDYGFFVPKDVEGKTVICEGELVEKTISVAEQRHYLKDEKASQDKIDAVKEPKQEVSFVADGVVIL